MAGAFQSSAFQNSAFQVATGASAITGTAAFTEGDDSLATQAYVFNTPPTPPQPIFNPGTEWQYFDRLIDSRRRAT